MVQGKRGEMEIEELIQAAVSPSLVVIRRKATDQESCAEGEEFKCTFSLPSDPSAFVDVRVCFVVQKGASIRPGGSPGLESKILWQKSLKTGVRCISVELSEFYLQTPYSALQATFQEAFQAWWQTLAVGVWRELYAYNMLAAAAQRLDASWRVRLGTVQEDLEEKADIVLKRDGVAYGLRVEGTASMGERLSSGDSDGYVFFQSSDMESTAGPKEWEDFLNQIDAGQPYICV